MNKIHDSKPPFRVPSMEEIKQIPWNGFSAISTFSGCGGSSLGYKMAGFRVLWASEFIPAAQATYRSNHSGTILDTRDIRKVKPEDVLGAIKLGPGELDLLDGSPPCASFSTAGKREAGWGKVKKYSDTHQRTDDLFFEFTRLIRGIKPKVFVAENVSGLVKGTAKGYFLEILKELKSCGYQVECRVLDAQWLGVPQMRQRTIFIGVRDDLGLRPAYPDPLPYRYSVKDAIPWIDRAIHDTSGTQSIGDVTNRPSPTVVVTPHLFIQTVRCKGSDHIPENYAPEITGEALGKLWDELKPGQTHEQRFNLAKPAIHGPCNTITATGGSSSTTASVVHPLEKRKFSIGELKRICGFPDDFILKGTYSQQWERLGRAVPPVMMKAIAEAIRDKILIPLRQKGECSCQK